MAMSFISNPIMVEDYVETSKQITKALKCVAFTNMQVGDMMLRKHDRLEKRIFSISEEIELLKADIVENVINQRERRQQLTDIEEDIERAEVLGNSLMVEELLEELKVLQEEGRREEALYRSIKKALRSRKKVKREFILEKRLVEDAMRTFNRKQNLIQSLLTTFSKDSALGNNSQSSSASQSDFGSQTHSEIDETQFVIGPEETKAEARFFKSRSLPVEMTHGTVTRPRRWSADETHPPVPAKPRTRVRRSLSVTFSASHPTSLGSVDEEEEENRDDLESEHQESEAALSMSSHEATSLLEEIHDEQDNYYSHASDTSDDDTASEGDEEHHRVHVRKAVAKEQPHVATEETRTVLVTDDESTTSKSSAITTKTEATHFSTALLRKHSDASTVELRHDQAEVVTAEPMPSGSAVMTELALAA
ncbi:hypothetical protein FI667_g14820, partial [Globisporangium splendens]